MLNSSLNVSRKKKKGLTPEEEEALRLKQASLFKSDHNLQMYSKSQNPVEGSQASNTPTFPSNQMPTPPNPTYLPTDSRFYDGSITQVLQSQPMNPSLQMQQTPTPEFAGSQNEPGAQGSAQTHQPSDPQEEMIDTSSKAQINAQIAQDSENKGKGLNFLTTCSPTLFLQL
jgi:hypothetical protein